MNQIFQVSLGHHEMAMNAVYECYPNRRAARAAWGEAEYVFVIPRSHDTDLGEIESWLNEIGIDFWKEATGPFTFLEFRSDLDAVAFKLRWL
jgi:hypothetical protein